MLQLLDAPGLAHLLRLAGALLDVGLDHAQAGVAGLLDAVAADDEAAAVRAADLAADRDALAAVGAPISKPVGWPFLSSSLIGPRSSRKPT